jgi:CHAD domain-containing protein
MPNRGDLRKLLIDDPEAFVRHSLLEQLAVLHVTSDEDLLGDNPEMLHDFRVAIRTLRSRLSFFAPYFKKPAVVAAWAAELKWLDNQLQGLRDIDVQIALLEVIAADRLQNLVSKPARYQAYKLQVLALKKELEIAAGPARLKVAAAVRSKRKQKLLTEVKKGLLLVDVKPKRISRLGNELNALLETQIRQISRKTRKPKFAEQSTTKLHSLRLDCKRTRYLAETLGHASQKIAYAQTLLGQINDLAILNSWLKARIFNRRRDRKVIVSLLMQTDQLMVNYRAELKNLSFE